MDHAFDTRGASAPTPSQLRRWAAAGLTVALLHALVLGLIATRSALRGPVPPALAERPLYLDITPRQRVSAPRSPATSPATATSSTAALADLPPVAVRPAQPAVTPMATSEPFIVDPAPVRPRQPGVVIPRSWRERCDIPPDAVVTEAMRQACERVFLGAARPAAPRRAAPSDPREAWAREGARRIRNWEALNGPRSGGTGNARPSDQPGSNLGMGDINQSVVPVVTTNGAETDWGDDD